MASCVKCLLPICIFVAIVTIVSAKPSPEDEPFDCPLNEVYHKCDQEVCYKTCEHLKRHPACPSVDPKCFKPACLCEKNTLRDSTGKCVPYQQCSLDQAENEPPVEEQQPEELLME